MRLRVVWSDRPAEVALPAELPVGELLPAVAALVGALDPSRVHRGFTLVTGDARVLDPEAGLLAQSVRDGAVLTLIPGLDPGATGDDSVGNVHDDLVEAVDDALDAVSPIWSADDSRTSARLLGGLTLLGGALVLGAHHAGGLLVVGAGLGAAVLLLLVGAVIGGSPIGGPARSARFAGSADIVVLAAGPFASVAGLSAGGIDLGRSILLAGLALVMVAAVSFVVGAGDRTRAARVALILPWSVLGTFAVVVGATASGTSLPVQQVVAVDLVAMVVVGIAVARVLPPGFLGQSVGVAGVLAVDLVVVVSAPVVGTHAGWAGLTIVGLCGAMQAERTRAVLRLRAARTGRQHPEPARWVRRIETVEVVVLVALLVVVVGLVPGVGPW
ncbi:MAG: EsaB/YukD family protein [Lapillicoccus sp.]